MTTNYDPLYEDAVASARGRVLRIPMELKEARSEKGHLLPQLLKLHGCVSEPESIVITRGDYMRYADQKGVDRKSVV